MICKCLLILVELAATAGHLTNDALDVGESTAVDRLQRDVIAIRRTVDAFVPSRPRAPTLEAEPSDQVFQPTTQRAQAIIALSNHRTKTCKPLHVRRIVASCLPTLVHTCHGTAGSSAHTLHYLVSICNPVLDIDSVSGFARHFT